MTTELPKRKRGRPSNAEKAARAAAEAAAADQSIDDMLGDASAPIEHEQDAIPHDELDNDNVFAGVSATWLAKVFRMAPETVKKRLAECPPKSRRRNYSVYDLAQAAQYLVPPKVDVAAYIRGMRPNDLPPILQDSYWSAMRKRQEWQIKAGELWPTDDVLNVFGELAMTLKSSIQLWVENLDRVHGLTPEMRQQMTQQSDNLLMEMHQIMVETPAKKRTPSSISEFDALPEEAEGGDDGL
ncbi:terminase small subunit [Achromobacter phage vB_AchrS_AchV4]|uniref:Terminase small subunit n=1 Tax=Achromobacter phage vB_AchrS_AchV4 TaxID=2796514 RepID=A0A7T3U6R7_9CAUD|nr:terminase small subunit [Achromobacter phage vB_AchrS_AchV4]QPZ53262.1 terminase small subunit [Achromobacter phage vB_AchrS_AchV4]